MTKVPGHIRTKLVVGGSCLAVMGAVIGLYLAMHSPLFTLRVVEVSDQDEKAPVDATTLSMLADAPVGRENLFTLDLVDIEARIKAHPWIRAVHLKKRFPQTLAINVTFREPKAMFQLKQGGLQYIDTDGTLFGQVNLAQAADLPVLSGFDGISPAPSAAEGLRLLDTWKNSSLGKLTQVSSIAFEEERGYRLLVTYPLRKQGRGRAMVELGQDIDGELEPQLGRLAEVFNHLSRSGASAREIWADAGKKIVVKIAHGS